MSLLWTSKTDIQRSVNHSKLYIFGGSVAVVSPCFSVPNTYIYAQCINVSIAVH